MGISYALKLIRVPALTHVLPPISTFRFAHLCRSRPRGSILAATHRGLAFYVGFPKRSIRPPGFPIYVARVPAAPLYLARSRSARPATLAASPAMSLTPVAPFTRCFPRNFTSYVAGSRPAPLC
jgi:hypothetical protein